MTTTKDPPKDEYEFKLGRRGADLVLRVLRRAVLTVRGEDQRYLAGLCRQLQNFLDTPPPIYLGVIKATKVESPHEP